MFRPQIFETLLVRSIASKRTLSLLLPTNRAAPTNTLPATIRSISTIPTTTPTRARASARTIAIAKAAYRSRYGQQQEGSSRTSVFKLLFASAGASFLLMSSLSRTIYNDAVATAHNQPILTPRQQVSNDVKVNPAGYTESRFNGALNYQELTLGSVTGLFLGIILGKLSQVFLFVSLSSFFLLEFLENRNIITIPWNYIFTIGKERVDVKQLLFDKPSFKISFVLSLIIAAYNV